MNSKVLILGLLLFSFLAFGQKENKRALVYNLKNGLAIQGYDPVSYFEDAKAVKGSAKFAVTYKKVIYNFSSEKNKQLFLKNPSHYEPQYGGWCAYAVGKSAEKVAINPSTFKIVDEKLYLFYNAFFNNTLKDWNKNEVNLKLKANENWTKMIQ